MATQSYLRKLSDDINKLLPPVYKVGCSKTGIMKGKSHTYFVYVDLVSAVSKDTLISRKKLMAGTLKECTIFLDGMYNSLLLYLKR